MPFIVWSQGPLAPKGKVDNSSVVSGLDLFISLSKIGGATLPANYQSDGTDMSKALTGTPQARDKALFWEYRRNNEKAFPRPADSLDVSPNIAIRDGDWKLLMNHDGSDRMLFNLYEDPRETTNLVDTQPTIADKLAEKALKWRKTLPELK
jgi:arylsulfatase A-like enzyme